MAEPRHRAVRHGLRLLTILILLPLAAAAASAVARAATTAATASTGPVLAYSFDETGGAAVADSSGNANNGTAANTSWSTAGKYGGALSLNGSSSWVTVPDSPSLDLTTGMTLEAWVNPSAIPGDWRTVVFKEQAGGMVYSLYAAEGTGRALGQVNVGGERNAPASTATPLNTWTFLAATFDGTSLRLYVNGTLASSVAVSGTLPVSNGVLRIGGNSVWGEWFSGLIDNVRVYDRPLSAAELQTDMASPVGGSAPPRPPPPPSPGTVPARVRINVGGPAYTSSGGTSFLSDRYYTGGAAASTAATISGTTDGALYQNERWGAWTYAIPVPNGRYAVKLHFAELYYNAPCAGKRVFSVDLTDTSAAPDLPNLDICAAVGPDAALVKSISPVDVEDGALNVNGIYGSADDPEITAIEVIPLSGSIRIDTGSSTAYTASDGGTFVADSYFTGGNVSKVTDAISGTSDPALFQSERWGGWSYAIPVANGTYNVDLSFAETYYKAPCIGRRVFSVDIANTATAPDIANLDVCAAVGPDAALVKQVKQVSVTTGVLQIQAVYGSADDPEITAIEIEPAVPGSTDTQAPSAPAGLTKTGATQTSISVSWNASTDNVGVAGYGLYRNAAGAGSTSSTSTTFSGLACGTTYTLGVDAYDAAGNRSQQATLSASTGACPTGDTQAPSTPTGLTKTGATQTSISVSWNASTDNVGVAGYGLYRNAASAGSTSSTSTTFSGLACGTTYTLAVDAYDAAGNRSLQTSTLAATSACSTGTASVFVSTGGSDSNPCTQSAPCRSFDRAYHVASPGQVVEVAGGSYPAQDLNGDSSKTSTSDVVIQPAAGATVSVGGELSFFGASHVTVRNMKTRGIEFYAPTTDATVEGINDDGKFGVWGASNVTIRGGQIYESVPSGNDSTIGMDFATGRIIPRNVLIDGVYFHDWLLASPGDHVECIQIWLVDGLTIRNSKFVRCAQHDLFINNYSPNLGSAAKMQNVTLENNWFGAAPDGYFAIQVRANQSSGVPCNNFKIRNNSFLMGMYIDCGGTGNALTNNILPSLASGSCSTGGWTFTNNLFGQMPSGCSAGNFTGNPAFVNEAGFDLHLTAGSPAIDRANPTDFAPTDIDGQTRPMGAGPDIGADEAR